MKLRKLLSALLVASAAFFIACAPVAAQWQVPSGTIPVGKGAGTGFSSITKSELAGQGLGWYIVGSSSYPTIQSAVSAANTAGGGFVWVPCAEYALGSGSIGVDMRGFRNVRVSGPWSVNAGGTVCGAIRYTGTGDVFDISGSYGVEISGLEIISSTAANIIKATNQGSYGLAAYFKIHRNTIFGKTTASGICLNMGYAIIGTISENSINCYIGLRGRSGPGDVSNAFTVGPMNTFQPGNSIHMQNAQHWNVFQNVLEGGLLGIAYQDTISGCSILNLTENDFDDPVAGGGATPLIDTLCSQVNSSGNMYAVYTGGTAINYQASSGRLKTDGDYFNTSGTGVALNTGNYAEIANYRTFAGISALYTGTAATTSPVKYIFGPFTTVGRVESGVAGTLAGSFRLFNTVSGYVELVAGAGALGSASVAVPAFNGDTLAVAAGAQNITNKTFNNSNTYTIRDDRLTLQDNSDATKQVVFELSAIATGNTRTWTFPNGSDSFLGQTGTQNVQNKNLDNTNTHTIRDDRFTLQDNGDTTKQAVLELSGITTATTRTFTAPNASGTLVLNDNTATLTNKSIDAGQLTGTIAAGRMPAFTGDCTTSAGAVATTCTKINNIDQTTAWTTYTPTVTSSSGTITTVGTVTGRYKQLGKTVFLQISAAITTVGTGAGQIIATLPGGLTAPPADYMGSSRDFGITGRAGSCWIPSGGTQVFAIDATNTTYLASGARVVFTITYELP